MTVIDASAFVEVLRLPEIHHELRAVIRSGTASAPALFDAEVLSRLVKDHKRGHFSADRVERSISVLLKAPIERVAHDRLLFDAWRRRAALSGYDALYVALAAQRGVGLVTADRRLARAPKPGVPLTIINVS